MGLAGQKLGNYELIAEIARGATTDLILARTRGMAGFERHVVLKRVRDERAGDAAFVEAFVTEARLAATLHHHNVVQVQDINEVNGVPYFAMEYVHGEDLRALLAHVHARKEAIPIQHVLTIGCAVAAALHHAHEQKTPDGKPLNIVHRDVTPANILAGYDGNVKVVDFGMAKAAITSVTQVGIKKGRAPYMAPEQCTGQRVDRRTDVFALGIVLYELVTARRLFKGASDHDTMMTIVHGSMPPARVMRPDLPLELSAVIMKALARLPADRYQTAAELGQALETYGAAAGVGISTSALATYLKQQLGERREPWLPGGSVRAPAPVDFDGAELGVASPAGESAPTTPRRDVPTMPAELAKAAQPVVAPDDDDDDENEPTATGGKNKANAEAVAATPAAAVPKKLDPTAFAPKPAGKPLPSITKRAKNDSDGWTDVSEPTRVDDEMTEEPSTTEMTRDEVAANLAGLGIPVATPAPAARAGAPVAAKAPVVKAAAVAASNASTVKAADALPSNAPAAPVEPPTRPTPQPVAKIALAKAPATSAAATSAAADAAPSAPTVPGKAAAKGSAASRANDPAANNANDVATPAAPSSANAAATANAKAVASVIANASGANAKSASAKPASAKPATAKLPPPSTSKSAPFVRLAPDENDLEIPNESGMRPGTDLDVPTDVGDAPHRERAETAEPLPAPPSTTAETTAGRPAKRTKSVSSEMSPTAAGGIVVETRAKMAGDLTLPVAPLPLELPATVVPDPKTVRRKRLLVASVGGVAVFAAIVAVIAFTGGASQAGAKPAEIVHVTEPAPAKQPEPAPAPAAAPSGGELTWNGVLDAGTKQPEPAAAPASEPAPATEPAPSTTEPAPSTNEPEPVAKQPEPVAKQPEPVAKQPEPAKQPAPVTKRPAPAARQAEAAVKQPEPVKAAAVRPVKKPVARPKPKPVAKPAAVKKATKPPDKPVQYDPNSLFLGK